MSSYEPRKKNSYFLLDWLFNRGSYIMAMAYEIIPILSWVVFHPLHTLRNQGFDHCSVYRFVIDCVGSSTIHKDSLVFRLLHLPKSNPSERILNEIRAPAETCPSALLGVSNQPRKCLFWGIHDLTLNRLAHYFREIVVS